MLQTAEIAVSTNRVPEATHLTFIPPIYEGSFFHYNQKEGRNMYKKVAKFGLGRCCSFCPVSTIFFSEIRSKASVRVRQKRKDEVEAFKL